MSEPISTNTQSCCANLSIAALYTSFPLNPPGIDFQHSFGWMDKIARVTKLIMF
jgi:hypothetical protein